LVQLHRRPPRRFLQATRGPPLERSRRQASARPQPLAVARVGCWKSRARMEGGGEALSAGAGILLCRRRDASSPVMWGRPGPSAAGSTILKGGSAAPLARSAPAVVVPVRSGAGGGGRRMGMAACVTARAAFARRPSVGCRPGDGCEGAVLAERRGSVQWASWQRGELR
jgi:hypothetical protein